MHAEHAEEKAQEQGRDKALFADTTLLVDTVCRRCNRHRCPPWRLIAPAAHWLPWVVHETALAVPEVPRQEQDRHDERVPEIGDDEQDTEHDLVEGEAHDPCDRERDIDDAFRPAT